jgi:anti-sigma-K factor RskA
MRLDQSLAEIERAFVEETAEDRERRVALREQAIRRAQRRRVERVHRHGSLRFWLVLLVLVATAVIVTVAMFQTLYYVMG